MPAYQNIDLSPRTCSTKTFDSKASIGVCTGSSSRAPDRAVLGTSCRTFVEVNQSLFSLEQVKSILQVQPKKLHFRPKQYFWKVSQLISPIERLSIALMLFRARSSGLLVACCWSAGGQHPFCVCKQAFDGTTAN